MRADGSRTPPSSRRGTPLAEHSATLTNMIAGVNDALLHAFSNGWADADFATARTALTGGAMDRYLARQEPQTIVDDLLRDPHLTVLRIPTPALGMMDALRSILNFKGKDLATLDRWIAASGRAASVAQLIAPAPKKNGVRNGVAEHRVARAG